MTKYLILINKNITKILILCLISYYINPLDSFARPLSRSTQTQLQIEKNLKFKQWIKNFKTQAIQNGISEKIYNAATNDLNFNINVLQYSKQQPEVILTTTSYLNKIITKKNILKAQLIFKENRKLLLQIQDEYKVPASILVAIWGMESSYGSYKGNILLRSSLASLSFNNRRSQMFQRQFLAYLKLVQEHKLPLNVKGSWAGAIGQVQFIPTTLQAYGIDGNHDNKIDIINSKEDALASAANYLRKLKWEPRQKWGREVIIPQTNKILKLANSSTIKTTSQWRKLKIQKTNHTPVPKSNILAKLYLPQGAHSSAFLLYNNFYTIYKWNRSMKYALAVSILSDNIQNKSLKIKKYPETPIYYKKQIKQLQIKLKNIGMYNGKVDGILGYNTSKAIKEFQTKNHLEPDGYISKNLLTKLHITP